MDKVLEITELSIEYKRHNECLVIVEQLSLKIGKSEIFGIVGESGCGKSTTALAIADLLPENIAVVSGSIRYLGRDLIGLSNEEYLEYLGKEIGIIFQDPMTSLNPLVKVGVQISEKLYLHSNLDKKQIEERTLEVLGEVGLPKDKEFLGRFPHELSGGMRQRVMIAIALINKPQLIIADEPTTSLDPTIQAQILHLLKEIKEKYQCTIILISHDFGVVKQICDRVAVMYAGQIVESANVSELFNHPNHPYTIGLMASIPSIDKRGQLLACIPGSIQIADHQKNRCTFVNRCSKATEECFQGMPNFVQINQGHFSRCFANCRSSNEGAKNDVIS
jgi:oligopeptide/dipeptide ABC transporter, ATP-binding protein, C-terminal domain